MSADRELSEVPAATHRSALRSGPLLPAEQLQSRATSATAATPTSITNPAIHRFTIPPSSTPSIGDDLNAHNISWKYYGDQWNNYVRRSLSAQLRRRSGADADEYCNICNPFQYDTSIMAHPDQVRGAHSGYGEPVRSDIANGHAARGFLRQAQRATSTVTRRPRSSICSRAS